MTAALDIIREEHRNLARVLKCLESVVRDLEDTPQHDSLELLNAIVFYIRSFPDRFHHPKEDQLLFPAVGRADPSAAPIIEQLRAEHASGEDHIELLQRALNQYRDPDNVGAAALRQAAEAYIAFQFDHMRKEEQDLLPRAEACLSAAEFEELDAAFRGNRDPLVQHNIEHGYKALADWIQQQAR